MAVDFSRSQKRASQHCIEYSLFARLADVAVRGVELQQRRSADRFGGSSLRRRACGASDDRIAKWPSTECTSFNLSRQVRNTNGKASLAPRTRCCHGTPSSGVVPPCPEQGGKIKRHSYFLARVVASCASISVRGVALIF